VVTFWVSKLCKWDGLITGFQGIWGLGDIYGESGRGSGPTDSEGVLWLDASGKFKQRWVGDRQRNTEKEVKDKREKGIQWGCPNLYVFGIKGLKDFVDNPMQ
jgi:hypothetical protein